MDIALYAPGLGYYSAGARKLGRGGDFTTAPEISRLFGACVAQQCADVSARLRRRIDPGNRRGQRPAGGGHAVAARSARPIAGALPDSRGERRSCASGSAARLRQRVPHLRRARANGSRPRPAPVSTASFSPTRCWTHCRCRAFAGTPPTARSWGSLVEQTDSAWAPRPAGPSDGGSHAPRSRQPAADGRTATCRSTARGSQRGRPHVTRALGMRAWRYGSITGCRGRSIIFPSGATAR